MPKTLPPLSASAEWEPTPNRKRFTRKECEFLEQNALLTGRYELIDGEILFKTGQNPPHRLMIMLVSECLRLFFGGLLVAILAAWIVYNTQSKTPFDPFPFQLLALIVGVEALLIVCVVLGSETHKTHMSLREMKKSTKQT